MWNVRIGAVGGMAAYRRYRGNAAYLFLVAAGEPGTHRRRQSGQRARKWYCDPERTERRTSGAICNEAMIQGGMGIGNYGSRPTVRSVFGGMIIGRPPAGVIALPQTGYFFGGRKPDRRVQDGGKVRNGCKWV